MTTVERDSALREVVEELLKARPAWVTGSVSGQDAHFLAERLLARDATDAVELGTASGFSTAVLTAVLRCIDARRSTPLGFHVSSFDLSSVFNRDQSKAVGDAARELLDPDTLSHAEFVHPATSRTVAARYPENTVAFLFIDAHHGHPWPTLDTLLTLDAVMPGGEIVFHDINLPLLHPQYQDWGAKHVFDRLELTKYVPEGELPNIGSVIIGEDKEAIRRQLHEALHSREWATQPPEDIVSAALAA